MKNKHDASAEDNSSSDITSFDELLQLLPDLQNLNDELDKTSEDARNKIKDRTVVLYNELQTVKKENKPNKDELASLLMKEYKTDCEAHASHSALRIAIYAGLATIACAVIGVALAVALCSVIGIGVVGLVGAGIAAAGISTPFATMGSLTFFMQKNKLEKAIDNITTDNMTPNSST